MLIDSELKKKYWQKYRKSKSTIMSTETTEEATSAATCKAPGENNDDDDDEDDDDSDKDWQVQRDAFKAAGDEAGAGWVSVSIRRGVRRSGSSSVTPNAQLRPCRLAE